MLQLTWFPPERSQPGWTPPMEMQQAYLKAFAALDLRQASQFAAAQALGTSLVWRGGVLVLVSSLLRGMSLPYAGKARLAAGQSCRLIMLVLNGWLFILVTADCAACMIGTIHWEWCTTSFSVQNHCLLFPFPWCTTSFYVQNHCLLFPFPFLFSGQAMLEGKPTIAPTYTLCLTSNGC